MEVTPTATVLLPVFNAESYLTESLKSLFLQTHKDFEILAINDGSRDGSARILDEYTKRDRRLRVLTQSENRGLVEALNLGLREAKGRFVFRHDSDDLAHPDRIRKSLEFLAKNPEVVLMGTWITRMDYAGKTLGLQRFPTSDREIRWQLLFRNPFAHSTVVFDREKALLGGGYSAKAKHAEDYDLWSRLASQGRLANLPESLCEYRVHDQSVSIHHVEDMEAQSARIGASWLASLLKAASLNEEDLQLVNTWEKFRLRAPLSPNEIVWIFFSLLSLIGTHPSFKGIAIKDASADLAWHLISYLKRQPRIAMNPRMLLVLLRYLPDLRSWPAERWRTS